MSALSLIDAFWRFTVATVGLLGMCAIWVILDYGQILRDWKTNSLRREWHRRQWRRKACCVGLILLVAVFPFDTPLLALALRLAAAAVYALFLWWLVFDLEMNRLRGTDKFYFGANAGTDLWLVRVARRFGWSNQYTHNRVKLPGLVAATLLFFTTLLLTS